VLAYMSQAGQAGQNGPAGQPTMGVLR
jgi:hypothetical protein